MDSNIFTSNIDSPNNSINMNLANGLALNVANSCLWNCYGESILDVDIFESRSNPDIDPLNDNKNSSLINYIYIYIVVNYIHYVVQLKYYHFHVKIHFKMYIYYLNYVWMVHQVVNM